MSTAEILVKSGGYIRKWSSACIPVNINMKLAHIFEAKYLERKPDQQKIDSALRQYKRIEKALKNDKRVDPDNISTGRFRRKTHDDGSATSESAYLFINVKTPEIVDLDKVESDFEKIEGDGQWTDQTTAEYKRYEQKRNDLIQKVAMDVADEYNITGNRFEVDGSSAGWEGDRSFGVRFFTTE